jgi:hypothetical protein
MSARSNDDLRTANAGQMAKFLWKEGGKYTAEQLQAALANAFKRIDHLEREFDDLNRAIRRAIRT